MIILPRTYATVPRNLERGGFTPIPTADAKHALSLSDPEQRQSAMSNLVHNYIREIPAEKKSQSIKM